MDLIYEEGSAYNLLTFVSEEGINQWAIPLATNPLRQPPNPGRSNPRPRTGIEADYDAKDYNFVNGTRIPIRG
jgi:hypothetical protein